MAQINSKSVQVHFLLVLFTSKAEFQGVENKSKVSKDWVSYPFTRKSYLTGVKNKVCGGGGDVHMYICVQMCTNVYKFVQICRVNLEGGKQCTLRF